MADISRYNTVMYTKENTKWSHNLAYAVGLLTTDGNLSSDGRHFTFVSKDIDQIKTFKQCLALHNKISPKPSGYSNKIYHKVQFGNVKLYRWLLNIGLKPNKKSVAKLNIPDKYFPDFLRGHIDGDGCFRVFHDPVYPNSMRLYTVFHSVNRGHLEWIQKKLKQILEIHGWIEPSTRIWRLSYAKSESKKLLQFVYHGTDIPFLKRKREIVGSFL